MTTTAGPPTNPEAAAARLRSALDADALGLLADDPLPAIPQLFDVRLELTDVDPRASGCSVHGTYFDDPPRITVVATASLRRRNFTALHELAHHLIALDDDLADALVVLPRGREAEEAVCDTFSASVLIPAGVLDATIPPAGPSAADVVGLYQRTQASRSACCAATARRLSGEGYVVLADRDGTIRYAAQAHPSFVIPPGTPQPANGVVARAGRTGRLRGQGTLTYATGTQSPTFHADAVADGEYVFAVLTHGKPPWGGLDILPDDGPRGRHTTCANCDRDFEAYGRPCAACGDDRCPFCKQCGCRWGPREATCPYCGLLANAELIAAGDCPNC